MVITVCLYVQKYPNIIKVTKLIDNKSYFDDISLSNLLKENEIYYEKAKNDNSNGYDFTDHCSRYAIYKTILHLTLNERQKTRSHIYYTYESVCEINIGKPKHPKEYWRWLNQETKDKKTSIDPISEIPVLDYDHKVYNGFSNKIIVKMKNIQKVLQKNDYKNMKDSDFCIEDILLISYMININRYKNKSPLSINELYSILNRITDEDNDVSIFYNRIVPIIDKSNNMIDEI